MSEIKCACGQKDCPIAIRVGGNELWFTDKSNQETLLYLDANTIINLISALREALIQLASPQQT